MAQAITNAITAAEARDLTTRINAASGELLALLKEAHDRQAWTALGYSSWREYTAAEFNMSRSYAYRLLDQAQVLAELQEAVSPMGDTSASPKVEISERQARAIKPILPAVVEEIREKVAAGADPVTTTYAVIEAKRAEAKPSTVVEISTLAEKAGNDDHDGPDLAELVDELQAENARLTALIEAAEQDDLKAEAIKWRRCYENAQRQQSEAMDRARREQKEAKRLATILHAACKAAGVDDPRKLVGAIKGRAAA